jgi:hypothetical protein
LSFQDASAVVEEANAAIASSSADTADEVAASSGISKGSLMAIGVAAGIAFGLVESAVSGAVSSAMSWDESSAEIANNLKNIGSSISLSAVQAYAEQIQNTTLFSQQQALSAEAVVTGYKNLAPQYQNISLLSADLATKMQQFTGSATADMPAAMKILTNSLNDPVAGLSQLQRQAGIDIPASVVTMIKNLANAGDTAGADSVILKALNGQVGGLAEAAAAANGGALVELENHLSAMGTTIGNILLPALDSMATALEPIVADIAAWATEHPKLTEALIVGVIVFTGLLAILTVIAIIVAAVGAAFAGLAVVIALAVAVIAGIVITNWTAVKNATEDTMNFIESIFVDTFLSIGVITREELDLIVDIFTGHIAIIDTAGTAFGTWLRNEIKTLMTDVGVAWNTGWTDASNFVQTIWNTIQNTVKTGVNDVISAINGFINALDSIHINIPAIQIPGTKIGTPALDLGFNIPDIPMLAAGGIVYNPVLAMIGEQGPEAVVPLSSLGSAGGGFGGGQPINIYIQGGNYLDQNGATMIGNALAKQIVQQLRVSNYRS